MADRPMWCDTFDMDLPKVIPNAREIVGDLGNVTLWTTGSTTDGVLNHPDVWNGDKAMLAFFHFTPTRSGFYVSQHPFVECTAWEAMRDAWTHSYCATIEGLPFWNTSPLWQVFESLMWQLRGWGEGRVPRETAIRTVERSLTAAMRHLRRAVDLHGIAIPEPAVSSPRNVEETP